MLQRPQKQQPSDQNAIEVWMPGAACPRQRDQSRLQVRFSVQAKGEWTYLGKLKSQRMHMAYETPYSYIYELRVCRVAYSRRWHEKCLRKLYERKWTWVNEPIAPGDGTGMIRTNSNYECNWCAVSCSEGVHGQHTGGSCVSRRTMGHLHYALVCGSRVRVGELHTCVSLTFRVAFRV